VYPCHVEVADENAASFRNEIDRQSQSLPPYRLSVV
jgi:hypothetical protein